MTEEFNCQRKIDESNGIEYEDDDNDLPDYKKIEKEDLIEPLHLIVHLTVVDLGAQFQDRGIPCYCIFCSNLHVLLRK